MSRIGKKPIPIPQGVKVQIDGATVRAEGPKGKLMQPVPAGLNARLDNGLLLIGREGDDRRSPFGPSITSNTGTFAKEQRQGADRRQDADDDMP